jgi:hypothetical protein
MQLSWSVRREPAKPMASSWLCLDIWPVKKPTRLGWHSGTLHRAWVKVVPFSCRSRPTFGMY